MKIEINHHLLHSTEDGEAHMCRLVVHRKLGDTEYQEGKTIFGYGPSENVALEEAISRFVFAYKAKNLFLSDIANKE